MTRIAAPFTSRDLSFPPNEFPAYSNKGLRPTDPAVHLTHYPLQRRNELAWIAKMRYCHWDVILASAKVEREIRELPYTLQARYLRLADLLERYAPHHLGMPHIRPIDGDLWELRLRGKEGIGRVLYVALTGRRLVMLHAFVKKTPTTPRRAIAVALRRLKEWQS